MELCLTFHQLKWLRVIEWWETLQDSIEWEKFWRTNVKESVYTWIQLYCEIQWKANSAILTWLKCILLNVIIMYDCIVMVTLQTPQKEITTRNHKY